MLTVETDVVAVEERLVSGRLACPGCSGLLAGWGHAHQPRHGLLPFACLLVGQPTLRRRMKLGVLAALDQRIGLRYAMPPMIGQECQRRLKIDPVASDESRPPVVGQRLLAGVVSSSRRVRVR
jgi:hypothetical protein